MPRQLFCCFIFLHCSILLLAQKENRAVTEHCGTMQRLEQKLQRNASLRIRFETQKERFNKMLEANEKANRVQRTDAVLLIPVVFHIVLPNPAIVTEARIQAQLDTLNKAFSGDNGDTVNVPSYFKSLFGRSTIQFCLAQRTPDEEATNGIERVVTSQSSFSTNDAIKHASSGGAASWNTEKYFNVWITVLSDNLLGYSSFPGDEAPDEQGVVIDYRALPGGSYASYAGGKTLVHETGHFFNLYHIWGDDGGSCTGTDYVEDTPNQANSSNTCYSGIRTDNCTRSGNGIMYQNYMDYTPDDCLVMFTAAQVSRMQTALTEYYSSLLTSDGCESLVLKNYNAAIISIDQPGQRVCSSSVTPVISIKNKGQQTLTSLKISVFIDEALVLDYNWSGSLVYNNTATITLPSILISEGTHSLTISSYNPNGNADEQTENDSISINIQYYQPVTEIVESFEGSEFPPAGWDVVNPDHSITWQKTTSASKTGVASVVINNHDYSDAGQKDDLRLPSVNILPSVDSAFLSFNVAAAAYTATTTPNNTWDTLEVLVSTDCGATFTSIYKKWGASLVTRSGPTTESFIPTANEWRKDSINLANYIGKNSLLIGFRNTTGYENNIYLDDINLRTVTVNSNLKNAGFLVTPVPTSGWITVQFYPQPANLQRIEIFNTAGQRITAINTGGTANNSYRFDLSSQAAGVYIVRAVFSDGVLVKKILKN